MAKSRGFTVEQKTEMKASYEQGTILKVLAEKWQVSVPTMSKYIKSVGGQLRNPGTPKKVKDVGFEVVGPVINENAFVSEVFESIEVYTPAPPAEVAGDFTFMKENVNYGQTEFVEAVPEIKTPQAPVARRIIPFE